jgi:hypothetical protein
MAPYGYWLPGPSWGSRPGRSACQPDRGKDGHGSGAADAFIVSSLGKYGREGQAMVAVLLALAATISFGGSDYTAGLASQISLRSMDVIEVRADQGVHVRLGYQRDAISHPPDRKPGVRHQQTKRIHTQVLFRTAGGCSPTQELLTAAAASGPSLHNYAASPCVWNVLFCRCCHARDGW